MTDATAGTSTPWLQVLVLGSPEYNMVDNIAYQPERGNWIVHEDGETTFERPHNNDLWSCLDDGRDSDLASDGCLRIASLNDLSAEWTGGFFDRRGEHFYVSVQRNKSGSGISPDITAGSSWQARTADPTYRAGAGQRATAQASRAAIRTPFRPTSSR